LKARDVAVFVADLDIARDRAMSLLILLGGLRAMDVRGLRLADVDLGLRRVRVLGRGGKERTVPVDAMFFTKLASYLRDERSPGRGTRECFLVRRDSWPDHDRGRDAADLFACTRSGTRRVRPHRLRHTYGTQLASAGTDLLMLRGMHEMLTQANELAAVRVGVPQTG
jgi:site-specific recombinase XerC